MKFRCERDTLAEAIGTAQRAIAVRSGALPVLSGVHVTAENGAVELVGSDLDLTIRVSIPAQVDEPGQAVVPAEALRRSDHSPQGGHRDVRGRRRRCEDLGRSGTRRSSIVAGRRVPEGESDRGHHGQRRCRTTRGGIAAGDPRRVPNDARPILTGVLMMATATGIRLVATDSYRLGVRDLEGVGMLTEGQKVLVGARAERSSARVLVGSDHGDAR